MKYYAIIFIALLLSTAPLSAAEKPSDTGSVTVTLEEALARILGNDHKLKSLDNTVEAQKQIVDFARYDVNNPEVRLQDISTGYIDNEPGDNQQFQIGLRWQPPRLGELGENEQQERVDLWEKKVKAIQERVDLIARVQRKYAELAMLQTEEKLAREQAALEKRRYKTVKKLIEAGQKSLQDGIKARRRSLKAAVERDGIVKKYEICRKRFAAMLGLSEGLLVTDVNIPLDMPSAAEFKRKSSESAALELSRQRTELVERRYRAERYRLIPWFSFVEAAYHYESEKRDSGELLLGIEIPLFNWNLGRLRATEIEHDNSGETKKASFEGLDRDIEAALTDYEQSISEYLTLKDEAEESLPQSIELEKEARRQLLPEDEIIEMEISDVELRRMLTTSAYAVAESAIEVCRISGDADCRAFKE